MPPGGGGGKQGCTAQGYPPTTGHRGHDDDAPHHFPAREMNRDRSPLTVHGEDAPPILSTEPMQEQEQHPMGSLPEGPLSEILSRVSYRSLCRFKCVSKAWLALCSVPDIRNKSSQTLSGFFYNTRESYSLSFQNVSGGGLPLVDPSLPFLDPCYITVEVLQCSGGLLLCQCYDCYEDKHDYVVCNPMTGQWLVLPPLPGEDGKPISREPRGMFLGFDAAVPSLFTVFAHLHDIDDGLAKMMIYSSKTERWAIVMSDTEVLVGTTGSVFLNDTMHLATYRASVFTVDTKGEVWGEFSMPDHNRNYELSIGQSQGRLHVWHIDNDNYSQLYVWVLEDYVSAKWTLKHTATVSELFERHTSEDDMPYTAFAIYPDSNCMCIADEGEMAVSYDMDNQKVNVICNLHEFKVVLPYIPCFAEWS